MSTRVQVILDEDEAARFRSQALKESKSLSAWLRDAGRKMLEDSRQSQPLHSPESLKVFFESCNAREEGVEPDWQEHKELVLEGFQTGRKT
jgi:hypothetical protein